MNLEAKIKLVIASEGTKKDWRDEHDSKEFKAAESLGKEVGSPLNRSNNCSCLEDLFIVLKILTKNNLKLKSLENMKTKQFYLKEGKVMQVYGHDPLTNDNLTDEKSLEILSKYPKCISQFETYPEDWEKLANVKAPEPALKVVSKGATPNPDKAPAEESAEVADDGQAERKKEQTREEELLDADVAVLRSLADTLFDSGKATKKASHMSKAKGLTKYILEHE